MFEYRAALWSWQGSGSGQDRLGLVDPQAGLAEGDNLFPPREFLGVSSQYSQGDELTPGIFDPLLLVFFGRAHVQPEEILSPIDQIFHLHRGGEWGDPGDLVPKNIGGGGAMSMAVE